MAIKNINTDLQIEAGLRDGDGDLGTNNQILISTGTGINWVDGSGSGIIGGPYLPLAGGGMTGTLVIGSQQLKFSDAGRLFMGDSNDLQIYHDGSNSYIKDTGTGNLRIDATNFFVRNSDGSKLAIDAVDGAEVNLRYNGSKKFETTNTGITVTGAATATTFLGDLNGTINTVTTAVTKPNATDDTTVATTAFVQNLIGTIPAGLVFQGTWNAATNTPTLTSGSGTTGHFYIVSTSGSTNLDGVTDWVTGDWAVFIEQGATDAWEKIDNSSVLDGTGTGNQITKWAGSGTSNTLTDSIITDDGTNVGIGTTSPDSKFTVGGNGVTTLKPTAIITDTTNGGSLVLRGQSPILAFDKTSTGVPKILMDSGGLQFKTGTLDAEGDIDVIIDSDGNVGIGTNDPDAKLHIKSSNSGATTQSGTLIVEAGSSPSIQLLSANSQTQTIKFGDPQDGDAGRISYSHSTNDMTLVTNGGDRVTIDDSGKVGIGTTSPGQKLDVSGNIRTNSNLYVYNSDLSRQTLRVNAEATTNTGIFKLTNGSNWGLLMRGESNTPLIGSYFGGGLNITGFEDSSGTTTSAIKLAQFVFGGTGGGSGYLTLNGDLRVNTNKKIKFGYANSQQNGIEWVAGSKISAAITPVDTANFSRTGLGFFTGDFSDGTTNADERMRITRAGNVGIGTTAPSTKLHVSGGVKITENLNVEGTGNVTIRNTTTVGSGIIFIDTTWQAGIEHQSGKLFFRTGGQTNRMVIDGSGNVGISTTSPGQKLHVVGEGKIQGNLMVGSSGDVSGAVGQLHIKGPNAQVIVLEDTDNANLVVRLSAEETVGFKIEDTTNSNVLFFGDENGNIGIGTITPATKLHVEDTTNPQARIAYDANNYVQVSVNNVGDTAIAPTGNGAIAPDLTLSAGSAYIKVDAQTNNVGIGTTTPDRPLSVVGGNSMVARFQSTNTTSFIQLSNTASTADQVRIGSNGTNLVLSTNYTERMRITSAGDAGIGVTTPRAKLDVAGGIKVADDTDTAGANKVGTLRYRYVPGSPKNYSYVDMCMQTGASSYAWVNIVQNVWN